MNSEEFGDWIDNPHTIEIMKYLKRRREEARDTIVEHVTAYAVQNNPATTHAVWLAGVIGGLNELIELTWDTLQMQEVHE